LSGQSKRAHCARRRTILAGAVLSLLPLQARRAEAQQRSLPPSTSTVPGRIVNVASTDSVAAIQVKLNSLPAGGTLVFPANSTFDFRGQTVRGKPGVTVLANGPVVIDNAPTSAGSDSSGAFDFSGLTDWTVRGKGQDLGFVLNGSLINAEGANRYAVGWITFNDVPSNGFAGSCVQMTGSSNGLIINNTMNRCAGNILGMYDWDNITVDGNHLTNCFQFVAVNNNELPDPSRGRNLVFRRNAVSGLKRAGIEIGPSGRQSFNGLVVDTNWFDEFGFTPGDDGSCLAISLVGQASQHTTVTNNFVRMGSNNPGESGVAIEFTGTGECASNLIWDFDYPVIMYGSGWRVHDNTVYNSGANPYTGFLNYSNTDGRLYNNTILTRRPAVPSRPARTAW
jgi:hypothetical protein